MANVSMSISQHELNKMSAMMKVYSTKLGKDANSVVKQWTKYLIKDIIKLTPPMNRKQGEAKVRKDIGKIATPLTASPTTEWGKRMNDIIKKKDVFAAQDMLQNSNTYMKKFAVLTMPQVIAEHEIQRLHGSKIRVNKKLNNLTLDKLGYNRYVKKIVARVGELKASWKIVADSVGLSVINWIGRHSDWGSKYSNYVAPTDKTPISIIMNNAPSIGNMASKVNRSLKYTVQQMAKDLRIKIKYLNKQKMI